MAFLTAAHAINPVLPVTCGPDARLPHTVCPPAAFTGQSADVAAPAAAPPEQLPTGLRRSTRRRARAVKHDRGTDKVQVGPQDAMEDTSVGAGHGGGASPPASDDSTNLPAPLGRPGSPKRQRLATPRRSPRGHYVEVLQALSQRRTRLGLRRCGRQTAVCIRFFLWCRLKATHSPVHVRTATRAAILIAKAQSLAAQVTTQVSQKGSLTPQWCRGTSWWLQTLMSRLSRHWLRTLLGMLEAWAHLSTAGQLAHLPAAAMGARVISFLQCM